MSTGPVVLAYPLGGSQSLLVAYLVIAVLGFVLVAHELRDRRASRRDSTPVRHRRIMALVFVVLAVLGIFGMLTLSATAANWPSRELVLNLLLLLVVVPAALGSGALTRRRHQPRATR